MKLFEVLDSDRLLLILKNYRDQADKKQDTLSFNFNSFVKQFNVDQYGLSTPESLKKWVEITPGASSIIDTVGIKDIKDPNPTILIKTINPGKIDNQPDSNPQTPTVSKMASRAAKKSLG